MASDATVAVVARVTAGFRCAAWQVSSVPGRRFRFETLRGRSFQSGHVPIGATALAAVQACATARLHAFARARARLATARTLEQTHPGSRLRPRALARTVALPALLSTSFVLLDASCTTALVDELCTAAQPEPARGGTRGPRTGARPARSGAPDPARARARDAASFAQLRASRRTVGSLTLLARRRSNREAASIGLSSNPKPKPQRPGRGPADRAPS